MWKRHGIFRIFSWQLRTWSSPDMAEDTALPNDFFAEAHTTRLILNQIADKWSVMILTILCSGPARFNAIKRHLDGITHKALTEALRRLERNGLLIRTV